MRVRSRGTVIFRTILCSHEGIRPCDAKSKKMWSAGQLFSSLLALISRAYPTVSLWHHEFIKATRSTALVVLN